VSGKTLRLGQVLAVALLCDAPALADVPRPVRLDYDRQAGAAACPDDVTIRAGVTSRLGYDPFSDQANDRMRVTLRENGRVLEARIELVDALGNLRAERRLVSHGGDCAELASSVELAMAIAIDPLGTAPSPAEEKPLAGGAPTKEMRQAPDRGTSAEAATTPAATGSSPSRPLLKRVEAGIIGSLGWLPAANLGLRAGGGLQGEVLSLSIEARADLPASKSLRVGQASAWLLAGSLVPCVHARGASACALATVGAMHVAGGGGLENPQHATLPYLALGVRVAASLPLTPTVSLAVHGDLTTPVTETRLTVGNEVVWASPTVAIAFGFGIAYRFP
jgi:hypothetical protein